MLSIFQCDKLKIPIIILLIMIYIPIPILNAQEATPTITPLPTPMTDVWPFPNGLYCADIVMGIGPTWREITIGESTIDELTELLTSYSDNYTISDRGQLGVHFSIWDRSEAIDKEIPSSVRVCTIDNFIVALSVLMPEDEPSFYLEDWMAQFGRPDAIAWNGAEFARTVFWFEEGISITVILTEPYGATLAPIFFPYQSAEGYENRWPYNRRYKTQVQGGQGWIPPLPKEENPFDFDLMLATITAQPTRTLTPQPTQISTSKVAHGED